MGCGLCGDNTVAENLDHLLVDCKVTQGAVHRLLNLSDTDGKKMKILEVPLLNTINNERKA